MFNAKDYVIDKVRRVTQENLNTGGVDWTMTNIQNPSVEFTGESRDKTDAEGVLLARFDGAKGVNFSGEGTTLSAPVMAAQLGSKLEIATDAEKVTGKKFDIVKVSGGKAELTFTPKTAPKSVYALGSDKNIEEEIEVGTGDTNASISGTEVTLPASCKATQIGVLYEYETAEAVKVVDSSESHAEAAGYLIDILAADICNPATKRAVTLVFPKAKLDSNFSINLTTEGTHPFSFSALKDYCDDDAQLCYWIFNK